MDAVEVFFSDGALCIVFVSHEGVFLWILDVQGDMTQDRANIFSDDDEDLVRKCS